ncbi:hypothetical protein [Algoriphagus aquimarinus]|uniref:Uncharacterized protein n=1 Tax=Algoriphagus aquimarinus TaxID=237018 RepID=A0A5C7B871_9BACT|nr:hypothetical protein [Algoriphagus aquimarinus]TXE14062.1 hypothetical protein ESV85_00435 [Algoriphagus aquimarinus]
MINALKLNHERILYWLGLATSVSFFLALCAYLFFFYHYNPQLIGSHNIPIWNEEVKYFAVTITINLMIIASAFGLAKLKKAGWFGFLFWLALNFFLALEFYIPSGFQEEKSHFSVIIELMIYFGLMYYLTSTPIRKIFNFNHSQYLMIFIFLAFGLVSWLFLYLI